MGKLKLAKAVTISGHPLYDNPSKWTSPGIFQPPSGFDKKAYQRSLDEIFGLSASGHAICRVSWAWECRKWANNAWDSFGNAISGEWRQRYRAMTVEVGDDEYVDISPPRFVLEERFEPGQYERSWEASRYLTAPTDQARPACRYCYGFNWIDSTRSRGAQLVCKYCAEVNLLPTVRQDVYGPAPRDGWYNLVPHIGMVAEHESRMQCCTRLWKSSKEICYGRYKVPDGRELRVLREAVARRNADVEANPHAELDEQSLQQARQWGQDAMNDYSVRIREEARQHWRDEISVHGAKLCTPQELAALKSMGLRVPKLRDFHT